MPQLDGEEKRIFDAVVKPERAPERQNGDAEAERERLRKGDRPRREVARERALRRERAGRGRRRRARQARPLPPRARCNRRRVAVPAIGWLESLSPWPGGRVRARADSRRCSSDSAIRSARSPPIHVVGTNGKSTTARTIARLLDRDGLASARTPRRTYGGWHERPRHRRRRHGARALRESRSHAEADRRDPVRDLDGGGIRTTSPLEACRWPPSRRVSAAATTRPTFLQAPVVMLTNMHSTTRRCSARRVRRSRRRSSRSSRPAPS